MIDKDRAGALPAETVEADALVLLTDVDALCRGFGTAESRPIGTLSPQELDAERFAAGSMGPKVEAACRFVESGGGLAGIGRLEDALAILEGRAGTVVLPSVRRARATDPA